MRTITENNRTIFKLKGEIDHHTAKVIRTEIDTTLTQNPTENIVLDFKAVEFMDSSGIGLVLGRYKLAVELNSQLVLQNLPTHLQKVMKIAGIEKLNIKIYANEMPQTPKVTL